MRRQLSTALRWLAAAIAITGPLLAATSATAATALADQPLFAIPFVPGNLGLVLSVEYPTAVSVAHTDRHYVPANPYLGYFDPDKCYDYRFTDGASTDNYYSPVGAAASNHVCSGRWSGNFLNWATMQTIDPFRWVLTGGYRVVDTPSLTVIEKAWGTGQGGTNNFPNSVLAGADVAGATPFGSSASHVGIRIAGLGNKMRFTTPDSTSGSPSFDAEYFHSTDLTGSPVYTRKESSIDINRNSNWPDSTVRMENVSGRWTGRVTAATAGTYTFRVRGDDGVRLSVNGQVLPGGVDAGWHDQGATNYDSADFTASAGDTFNVVVEWYQRGGGAEISLQWRRPGDSDFSVVGASMPSLDGSAVAYQGTAITAGTVYEAFVRAKVCDPAMRESNCTAYADGNYKPEGLLQQYSNKIRYSAFGYLNTSNILWDGGVLRAQQKFVGPLQPVPGSAAAVNPQREWDGATGVFIANPDSADASASAMIWGNTVNSGVLNYLNKFGELDPGEYKLYDNVSELYYAAIRYFKAMPDVPEWTSAAGLNDSEKKKYADGFPVITGATDPILYSCQRNFILGIGDVNTNADKNVPGRLAGQTGSEPSLPAAVSADTSVNAVAATDLLGNLEGLGNIASNATYNTPALAGLAYDAHVKDIRPDDPAKPQTSGKQTIDTYWVDVMEYQRYLPNNLFYLATKYGGFTVPTGYTYGDTLAQESWWHTTPDLLEGQKRPDNYYSGGRPDLVRAGLQAAFTKIAAAITSYTTSFSTSLPQVATTGNSSFASKYDANTWTGEIEASSLTFDANYSPSVSPKWTFTGILATQLAGDGWSTRRRLLTWNGTQGVAFRASGTTQVASTDLATLDTTLVSGNDSTAYLNYLRGDRTNEVGSTASGSTKAYRLRTKLLGDIVGSKAKPVGPPSFPFADSTNAGYSAFKSTWSSRRTVVYVGSNDGILHAINGALDGATDSNFGTEMFGYVPRALFAGPSGNPSTDGLASLGNPSFTHHYMVNATPLVYDIDMTKTDGSTSGSANWRSVLIGGLGKGGKSYFAIDVTDPVAMAGNNEDAIASKVLWEFTDPALGFTYGDPLVVKTRKYGWVVILPSGYNNTDGQGYLLFVNPRTGALLEKVSTGVGSTSNDAGLAHANAFVVDATDGTADAVYAGDLLGNVWRLDITGTGSYSASGRMTKLATLTDGSGSPQAITSSPAIEVHPRSKQRFVMVGTGRLLDPSDVASVQPQTFYSFIDGSNASFGSTSALPSGVTYPYTRSVMAANTRSTTAGATFDATTQIGWYEELGVASGSPSNGIAWRITSDSSTLNGYVAFTSTLPNGSVCSPSGDSRVYARDYASAKTGLQTTVNSVSTPVDYVSTAGTVTDLRYLSVSGHAVLISGTDTGNVKNVEITPPGNLQLRRLNWRELQSVD